MCVDPSPFWQGFVIIVTMFVGVPLGWSLIFLLVGWASGRD